MIDWLKNTFFNRDSYKTNSSAVIISCYFNPQNNPYRLLAFQKWYKSIRHLPHRIVECLVGPDAKSHLPDNSNISQVHADSLLFHKEALLNKIVRNLPRCFKYIFWVDADVIFTNDKWLTQGVQKLQHYNLIQPFEFCVHLERNQISPDFSMGEAKKNVYDLKLRNKKVWRSFSSTYQVNPQLASSPDYNLHGHVGFAWGARREVLENVLFYEEAVIGGADHILAHAAAGHIPHSCIQKGFADNLEPILEWSKKFYSKVRGSITFVPGDLYHLWHGDIKNRNYLKRIQDFTKSVPDMKKDRDGFYKTSGSQSSYVKNYYKHRETDHVQFDNDFNLYFSDLEFLEVMGYLFEETVEMFTQPSYVEDDSLLPDPVESSNIGQQVESNQALESPVIFS